MVNLRGGVDYDLDKQNRISGEVRYRGMSYDTDIDETYANLNAAGAVARLCPHVDRRMRATTRHQRRLAAPAEGRRARADQPPGIRGHQLPARRQALTKNSPGRPVRDHSASASTRRGPISSSTTASRCRAGQAEDGLDFEGQQRLRQ
jgi:hypothetical protein